jgi:hypothetical protein
MVSVTYPLPGPDAVIPDQCFARQDSSRDQRTESSRKHRCRVENGHSKVELALGIPLRKVEEHTSKERSFDDSQDETASDHSAETLDLAGEQRYEAPSACEESEV